MTETSAHTEVTIGSERSFGIVFGTVFLILGMASLFSGGGHWIYFLAIAAVWYGLAFVASHTLRVPNRLWFRFGLLLHAIFSPILMFAIYVATLIPTGLVFRVRGKDLLHREIDAAAPSYWVERTQAPGSMRRQF